MPFPPVLLDHRPSEGRLRNPHRRTLRTSRWWCMETCAGQGTQGGRPARGYEQGPI